MRLVCFGSGAFGLPTFEHLRREHRIALVVTQPDRPANRGRKPTPTPVGAWAAEHGLPVVRPESPDDPELAAAVAEAAPDALVVIAYGGKLGPALLEGRFAINLHASLLPRWRGAAPIHRAIIAGDARSGVSVIALAERMDAGAVYARRGVAIEPTETAGELHDRLAALGPEAIHAVLAERAAGRERPEAQDEQAATHARKLAKDEGTARFDAPAESVRARINGLNPWPGCTVRAGGARLKLLRAAALGSSEASTAAPPGTVLDDGTVACAPGRVQLLAVQPAGGRSMTLDAWRRGHREVAAGLRLEPLGAEE